MLTELRPQVFIHTCIYVCRYVLIDVCVCALLYCDGAMGQTHIEAPSASQTRHKYRR